VSTYKKNLFSAPHLQGGILPPDLTRLPANMRDAVHRPDPMREDEAAAHLLVSSDPISIPAARLRVNVAQEVDQATRLGIYAVDPSGTKRIVQLYLDPAQARVLYETIGRTLEDPRMANPVVTPVPVAGIVPT